MTATNDNSKNPFSTLPFHLEHLGRDAQAALRVPETRLYFLLSGSARILLENHAFSVQAEDIFLVNAGDSLQILSDDWDALELSFRQELLPLLLPGQLARFDLNSAGSTFASRYDYPRYCLSRLSMIYEKKELIFSSLSIFYALYNNLQTQFLDSYIRNTPQAAQQTDRLLAVINYINEHYRENLSLNETAARFGLSVPYFSAAFKKQTSFTFFEYYNRIRLFHAVSDLLLSGDSIESVAVHNGFSDSRSFTALFKKQFGVLPNVYRKEHRMKHAEPAQPASMELPGAQESREDLPHAPEDPSDPLMRREDLPHAPERLEDRSVPAASATLQKYADIFREEIRFVNNLSENPRLIDAGEVSCLHEGRPLTHNFHKMIGVGSAKQFLYKEVQEMLIRMQKEIRFEFVKFHGMLSDEMMVYSEDGQGNPRYSFTILDKVFDFLRSIGLRPLCQLSFMPIALAEDPSRLFDFYHYNTSPPKNIRKWTDLVQATVRHFISRYGLEEVKSWLFCVWNEPDETVEFFAWDDRNRFFDFYVRTFKAIKSICPDLQVGTPSLLLAVQKDYGWAGDFFVYCYTHGCHPDFLNMHYYDNSLFEEDFLDRPRDQMGFSPDNTELSFPLTADPHAMSKFIGNVKNLLRKHNMRGLPIYLTEWNLTISHRDLINDTCFKSCHLVKNLLENYDRLSSFSYWCLTDFLEELQLASTLYHGGLGLFTYNAIPKANYNAFVLLNKLGDVLLEKGDGYFITRSKDRISMMLYNYEHYSKLFASGRRTEQNTFDRYSPFEEKSMAQFAVRIRDLPDGKALVKEWFVNQYAGSSYDAWERMGSGPLNSEEDYDLLMQESRPGLHVHQETIENGILTLHPRLAPLEVRLLTIEPAAWK